MSADEAAQADWEDEGGAGPWTPPAGAPQSLRSAALLGLLFGVAVAVTILVLVR